MQEFGSDGGVGRVFGAAELRRPMGYLAAAAAGPHPHPQPPPPPPPPQIKCPRCESTNTKFCYYNNYNLSQPRHFCKSCRRYWTKGGVLRNVPVGGGCRKSKRAPSKTPSSSSSSSSTTSSSSLSPPSKPSSSSPSADAAAASDKDHRLRPPASSSRSSSDSSTLTAAADQPSGSNPTPHPFETLPRVPRIFPEPSATFANMVSAGSGLLDLGFSHPAPAPLQSQQPKSAADEAIGTQQGFADQTVGMDLSTSPFEGRSNGGGGGGLTLNGLDWPGTVDPTLFDLSGAVDHWTPSHWGDTDPSLYLP